MHVVLDLAVRWGCCMRCWYFCYGSGCRCVEACPLLSLHPLRKSKVLLAMFMVVDSQAVILNLQELHVTHVCKVQMHS